MMIKMMMKMMLWIMMVINGVVLTFAVTEHQSLQRFETSRERLVFEPLDAKPWLVIVFTHPSLSERHARYSEYIYVYMPS
jgi:hypothetical protein